MTLAHEGGRPTCVLGAHSLGGIMKKLLLGALSLGIPGLFFFGNVTYAPRAEAQEREACTFHYYDDDTYTNHVLTLRCACGESSCSETEDVTPFFIMECRPC